MKYKAVKGEIMDEEGRQVMLILPTNCSKKFRDQAAKSLAEVLNTPCAAGSNGEITCRKCLKAQDSLNFKD